MLARKTLLGAAWTVSSRLTARAIDFVTLLVLARILTPADFGLTALAATVTIIADMVLEVPTLQALTRLPSVTKSHLDTAFTLSALRGIALTLVLLLVAWPFAQIYQDSRLASLIIVSAIGPLARSLYSPGMVEHTRSLAFRPVFVAEIFGKLAAAIIAATAVRLGAGYWAIVASGIAASLAATSMSYLLAPYRPNLSLSKFREFSAFLGWLSGAQIIIALSWQFDRILLGYSSSKATLGQYTIASDLSVMPTQSLIGPAMQPLMAALSQINQNQDRLRHAYSKASRLTMSLAAPACIGMSLTADLIAEVLLGPQWGEAGLYLRWLALSTVLSAFYQPLHSLALATNRTHLVFRLTLVELCAKIVLMCFGFYFYSLAGVVAARAAVSFIMFVLSLIGARQLVGTSVASEAANLWPIAAACAVMTLLVMGLRYKLPEIHLAAFFELGVISLFGASVYVGALYGFGVRVSSRAGAV
ncbi:MULTISPECIES: lipopolysaccharide biosynthesis protein [Bradyrhizobium]|uniref:Lipopolysaccharide biosynthesis protein n=1 Tax=Bradyrhizobium vignae TaxID=1549949 RepID=A0ABS4A0G7_9BRAD|nr:lipopolysaccharide biosynthesis protein [Bradyrhizobium vignae]MBP0113906.1 lipopolysaccharide biosynthesis protein [Bradyrhizobium vignae]RXG88284.1 lipopolysaccharide biosynthesis protein [Bradyrhizobium vignae]